MTVSELISKLIDLEVEYGGVEIELEIDPGPDSEQTPERADLATVFVYELRNGARVVRLEN